MFREQLEAWLKAQGRSYSISGKEIKTKCLNPEHHDNNPSFSINYVTGLAYCFSCSYKSHANIILGVKPDEDQLRISKYLELNRMWEQDVSEDEPPASIELPPVDFYIEEELRGIPKEVLSELGIYYCSVGRYSGRLIFPVRDTRGNLLGFDARIYEHPLRPKVKPQEYFKNAKYLRPSAFKTADNVYPLDYLWNHRNDLDLSSIVITEGIFDAISYIALGIPSVCQFGLGAPSVEKAAQLMSLGTQGIINGLDGDTPSIKAWQGDPEKGKSGLKDIWRKWFTIEKPNSMVLAVRASGMKDANDYIQNLVKG